MKLKIYYKSIDENIHPVVLKDGEWFDLMAAEDHTFSAPHNAYNTRITQYDSYKISLGIAMSLPVGIEAILAPRSSLFEKKGLELVNSIGVIDSTYSGNSDIWNAYLKASRDCVVTKGERIVQFRLQPSQRASVLLQRLSLSTLMILVDLIVEGMVLLVDIKKYSKWELSMQYVSYYSAY